MAKAKKARSAFRADEYSYRVAWSPEDEVFVGRVAEFQSLAAHGDTLEAALAEIRSVVAFVLDDLAESGEPTPEPFSRHHYNGKVLLRMPEKMHRGLVEEAARQGVSLNQLINLKLTQAT